MSTVESENIDLWMTWKRVTEVARGRILADVTEHSAVTEPELTILVILDRAGGTLRQNALAGAAGWDRTRLSHLLTRMEERGHLSRERLRNGVELTLLPSGRDALESTRSPLAAAVERHLVSKLTAEQVAALHEITAALSADVECDPK